MKIGSYDLNKDGICAIGELSDKYNSVLQNALDTTRLAKEISGADADFSLDKKEFSQMIQAVRDAEKLLGKIDYSMTDKKKKNRQFARSLYLAKDIKKGEIFSEENIRSVRSGYGVHPKYLKDILGKPASKNYQLGDKFTL